MTDGDPFDVEGVWLKAALHTHTPAPTGSSTRGAVEHHDWLGFDVCAITDHWTLTKEPSTEHCLVITGAELAADPHPGMDNDVEILAIGIGDIPEDPGGSRDHWGPMTYIYKTFPICRRPRHRSPDKEASRSSRTPTGAGFRTR